VIEVDTVDGEVGEEALDAPGGFIWWYLDIVDGEGNGAVVIWSYGLPFLPGYAAEARSGDACRPRDRPSLNVAVYRDGKLDCYLLQEYEPAEVTGDLARRAWSFGSSRMRVSDTEAGRRVVAELDCTVPGTEERLTGTVSGEGAAPKRPSRGTEDGDVSQHRWMPLAVSGTGRVDLEVGETESYDFEGCAYHDANCGTKPLHELGIRRWHWGRVSLADREVVYYRLAGEKEGPRNEEQFAVVIDSAGSMERIEAIDVELRDARRNLGGLRWWKTATVSSPEPALPDLEIHHRSAVDSGPFYMRYLTEVAARGERASGVAELIRPDRIDMARHRPFVRMRVHRTSDSNSMWLPLFTGPKRGRLGRLLRHNFGGGTE